MSYSRQVSQALDEEHRANLELLGRAERAFTRSGDPEQPAIARQIDDPHSSAPDLAIEFVVRAQHALNVRAQLSVGCGGCYRFWHALGGFGSFVPS